MQRRVQQAERTRHACINNARRTSKRKREVDLPSGEPGCKQDAAREDNARTRRSLARSLPSEIPGYSPVNPRGYTSPLNDTIPYQDSCINTMLNT